MHIIDVQKGIPNQASGTMILPAKQLPGQHPTIHNNILSGNK